MLALIWIIKTFWSLTVAETDKLWKIYFQKGKGCIEIMQKAPKGTS